MLSVSSMCGGLIQVTYTLRITFFSLLVCFTLSTSDFLIYGHVCTHAHMVSEAVWTTMYLLSVFHRFLIPLSPSVLVHSRNRIFLPVRRLLFSLACVRTGVGLCVMALVLALRRVC